MKQKRILAFLLSAVMTLSLFPTFTLTASAEETQTTTTTEKNITLGKSALSGYDRTNGYKYVYYGTYNTSPIKWRILSMNGNDGTYKDNENKTVSSENAMFLLSEYALEKMKYDSDGDKNDDSQMDVSSWRYSDVWKWCNDTKVNTSFISSSFTESEMKYLLKTSKGIPQDDKYFDELVDDTFFFLSDAEARNINNECRNLRAYMVTSPNADAVYWWLRTPDNGEVRCVCNKGFLNNRLNVNNTFYLPAARPAFNLNLSSVLFTSAAKDGKNVDVGTISKNADFGSLTDNDGYKLTLKDSSRKFKVNDGDKKKVTDKKITVGYSGATTGDNEYISAILTAENSNDVLYYGQLAEVEAEIGTVTVTLPSDIAKGKYTLKLFNEQINGNDKTDFSSEFSDIALTIGLEGSGTEENPYLISDLEAFEYFRDSVSNGNKYTGEYINLTADIDLTGRTWSPIGVNYSDFEGIFDGQNHTISNMKFTAAKNGYGGDDHLTYDYQGLFGIIRNGAIVRNFTVTGEITLAVDNQKYIGGAVGFAYEDALVSNVTSYVNITDGGTAYSGITDIGGVVGRIGNNNRNDTNGYVDWCKYYGEINVDTASKVGGIVGCAIKKSSVTNSTNYGTVGRNYIGHIGGVVGSTENEILVKNCANYGSVSACHNDCIGGVVGYIQNGTITNCLNGGSVTGKKSNEAGEPDVYLGGILGYQNNSSLKGVTNCFNYGKITDLDGNYTYTGAIIGFSKNSTGGAKIKDNYYLDSSLAGSAQKASGRGTVGTNTSVTPIKAASGELAYKMQEYISDGEKVWGQTLSGESKEEYPSIYGAKVYSVTECDGDISYANEASEKSHDYVNDVCTYCGASRELTKNSDGYYQIASKADFIHFKNLVNANSENDTLNAVLTADIDLSGYDYIPIGREGSKFTGTFDGAGHKIENLTMTADSSYMGMFGITNGATVKNFTVSGDITAVCNGLEKIGGVIGQADNTSVSDVISKVNFKDNGEIEHIFKAGGIMAVATAGTTITNCEYSGDVKLHFGSTMGGMVGDVCDTTKENPIVIKKCVNKANMTFDISRRVAGIVGWNDAYTTVSQCTNYGNITIQESDRINQAAGIVGANINALTVEDCANYGVITDGKVNSSLGGIVGFIEVKENARDDFGGVKNCFNYGKITHTHENGSTYCGSVIGFLHTDNESLKAKITDNYYLKDTALTISGTAGIALTATEVSADTAAGGEVAYILQGLRREKVWGQTLTGETATPYPVLGGETVHKVTFMVSGETYAAKYANETGIGTLPEKPGNGKWFCGETADSAEFTVTTPVTEDMKVYFRAEPDLIITTADEMKAFAAEVNGGNTYNGKYILLKNDLNLEGSENNQWTPIGTYSQNCFKGTFDGDGHKIVGLYINNDSNSQGLFGYVGKDGTVKNLIVDGTVYGNNYSGGIAGINEGTVENCSNTGSVNGENYVGGIVGSNYQTVKNCYNTGAVNGGTSMYVGGVAGENSQTVENCYNTGAVNGGTSMYVGGIVGYNYQTVKNCYNTGAVSGGTNEYVGGAFGYSSGVASVPNCFYLDTCAAEGTELTYSEGVALTAEQIKNADEFTGFDFTNTWVIKIDRPLLKSNLEVQNFEIKSVGTDGTNVTATVFIPKAGIYKVVFADYENGRLNDIDVVPFTVTAEQLGENTVKSTKAITLGTDDKIMLWDEAESFVPKCDAYEIKEKS